ncbi:unnamed protein product [Candidula unifasciata]|uniref:Four-jointed n=1 Tax=Candidula unifasciata TaxID=100452 RepID=A0A8S4A242_9EUPU|nr:unnamed protein product [Candidula unifasciata]
MRALLVAMTGIGFTLGVVFGLLLQLPIDNTLPADSTNQQDNRLLNISSFRSRSLREELLPVQQFNQKFLVKELPVVSNQHLSFAIPKAETHLKSVGEPQLVEIKPDSYTEASNANLVQHAVPQAPQNVASPAGANYLSRLPQIVHNESRFHYSHQNSLIFTRDMPKLDIGTSHHSNNVASNKLNTTQVVSIKLALLKAGVHGKEKREAFKYNSNYSQEDSSYIASIVNGVLWTPQLEESCPKPFLSKAAEAWRKHIDKLDVVKMEQGCGRMQNRLITFRDSSKACVRYRLNTDQIQGEIYTYYLSRLLNMFNIPPTMLAQVNSIATKWKTVHLKMSLAQWADSKLVVLTKYIDGLSPAHIPTEFQEKSRRLEPTLSDLGAKSHADLCELVQWSDLIVLDYLTANLDRVINNMFNRQWNDQMMSSPAHNLERRPDGGLVFLDNESGLFHGYRLLDKYSEFHRMLLKSLCVFRESTAVAVKRLYKSSSIGKELHSLLATNEVLHKHLAAISDKNVKILQQRLNDVFQQISQCERLYNR